MVGIFFVKDYDNYIKVAKEAQLKSKSIRDKIEKGHPSPTKQIQGSRRL